MARFQQQQLLKQLRVPLFGTLQGGARMLLFRLLLVLALLFIAILMIWLGRMVLKDSHHGHISFYDGIYFTAGQIGHCFLVGLERGGQRYFYSASLIETIQTGDLLLRIEDQKYVKK